MNIGVVDETPYPGPDILDDLAALDAFAPAYHISPGTVVSLNTSGHVVPYDAKVPSRPPIGVVTTYTKSKDDDESHDIWTVNVTHDLITPSRIGSRAMSPGNILTFGGTETSTA